ncbi:MAG: hypothetical protein Q9227_001871 [Pyrenula ochraceoflavens]
MTKADWLREELRMREFDTKFAGWTSEETGKYGWEEHSFRNGGARRVIWELEHHKIDPNLPVATESSNSAALPTDNKEEKNQSLEADQNDKSATSPVADAGQAHGSAESSRPEEHKEAVLSEGDMKGAGDADRSTEPNERDETTMSEA